MLGNKKASKMTSSILASIVAKIPQLIYLQNWFFFLAFRVISNSTHTPLAQPIRRDHWPLDLWLLIPHVIFIAICQQWWTFESDDLKCSSREGTTVTYLQGGANIWLPWICFSFLHSSAGVGATLMLTFVLLHKIHRYLLMLMARLSCLGILLHCKTSNVTPEWVVAMAIHRGPSVCLCQWER